MTHNNVGDQSDDYLDRLSEQVLGAPRQFTSREIAESAQVPIFRARKFWRALGFANVADDEREFTRTDAEALTLLLRLVSDGILDESQALQLTRLIGRTSAQLARSYADIVLEPLGRSIDPLTDTDSTAQLADRSLSDLQSLLVYSWRRQVAAALDRIRPTSERTRTVTVGFADLVAFTQLSRQLSDDELTDLVSRFEERSANVITGQRGRLIKSLGDGVLFVAKPADAADIALRIVENVSRRRVPGIRVGLEYGPVIGFGGDIFGDTVNLASRLTALAEPNSVMIGERLAEMLAGLPDYEVEPVAPVEVRGYGLITPAVLRKSGAHAPK